MAFPIVNTLLQVAVRIGYLVFGYFAGRRGAGCSLRGAGHDLLGAGHDLLGAGCEMLSLILELQTCQLDLCFAHVVTIH